MHDEHRPHHCSPSHSSSMPRYRTFSFDHLFSATQAAFLKQQQQANSVAHPPEKAPNFLSSSKGTTSKKHSHQKYPFLVSAFLLPNVHAPTATTTLMENTANPVALVHRWTRSRTTCPKAKTIQCGLKYGRQAEWTSTAVSGLQIPKKDDTGS
ncbi:hypothetical protein DM01DRAFT_1344071 [Hesseltinella vesiculosa]|uniref:Uncharacterized protein n=1 Tax=Hesseltinella vesiculosa TaxID=101127 RepID=A0A1X2GNW9_9FUNG|nr:hypothetical protein DM01DRAFT_1344071 [Hesseltinella vesiculosa]